MLRAPRPAAAALGVLAALLLTIGEATAPQPRPLLLAAAEVPEAEVQRLLAELKSSEFIYETRLFPDPEYTFKHALTHDVAYGGLLGERRRALHDRILAAMEQIYADRRSEALDRMAFHALRAESWEKALAYADAHPLPGEVPEPEPEAPVYDPEIPF